MPYRLLWAVGKRGGGKADEAGLPGEMGGQEDVAGGVAPSDCEIRICKDRYTSMGRIRFRRPYENESLRIELIVRMNRSDLYMRVAAEPVTFDSRLISETFRRDFPEQAHPGDRQIGLGLAARQLRRQFEG